MAAVSVGSLPPEERAGLHRLLRTIFQPHDTVTGNGSRQLQAELLMSVSGESKEDTCVRRGTGGPEGGGDKRTVLSEKRFRISDGADERWMLARCY